VFTLSILYYFHCPWWLWVLGIGTIVGVTWRLKEREEGHIIPSFLLGQMLGVDSVIDLLNLKSLMDIQNIVKGVI
jgi:hypothetical protein